MFSLKNLTRIAFAVALIVICAQIRLPLPIIPFTLQTFGIGLIAVLLTPKEATSAILLYLLLGAIGLPVFSGAGSGLASFTSATGGFLIGFIFFVLVTAFLTRKKATFWWTFFSLLVGDSLAFLAGWLGLLLILHLAPLSAFTVGVLPYLISDVIKMLLISLIAVRLKPLMP